jgi:hypothetical protein
MRKLLPTLILAISTFLVGTAAAAPQISVGISIGAPPPPRAYHVPPQPGPDYYWVEGYWYPQDSHYRWHDGYWTRPPYAGAYWVSPYYSGGRYYQGYWAGGRPNLAHDHRWDRDSRRDEGRDRHDESHDRHDERADHR